jgi:hypothetical protein
VFDRERTDADTDIDFDFFDDDAPTTEARPRGGPPPPPARPKRRIPTGPPSGPSTPVVRLVVALATIILLVVLLVVGVSSCQGAKKRDAYQTYMNSVGQIGGQSEGVGRDLGKLVTTPGLKLADLQARLNGLRQQQEQLVARAQKIDTPGPLREQQQSFVEALQFRVSGLAGLAKALTSIKGTKTGQAGRDLAVQAERLVASDVVYQDLFQSGSQRVLDREGIKGVAVPDSNFLQDEDLASPRSWSLIVQRLTQTPTAGGLHGTNIVSVKVEPGDQTLSASQENTVTASDRLAFVVTVQNSGDSQEAQVQVHLNIQQSPQPVKKTQTIDIINPNETKSVTFRELGSPSFGERTTVQVTVEPVPGEKNTSNNTAEYAVVFTLG